MLNEKDQKLLDELLSSLKFFALKNGYIINHEPLRKPSQSLYRFGWFYINGYLYSISGWKYKDGIVTFENEKTGEKVKYSIFDNKMLNGEFKKDSIIEKIVKLIRRKISIWLRNLSDKLQP